MEKSTSGFQPIFRIAIISAWIMILLIPVQIVIFVISPPPSNAQGFLDLFNNNPILGLLSLDLLYLINNVLIIPIYLAIAVTLRHHSKVLLPLALILGFVGIAAYYPTNPAFEFLYLAPKYAYASSADKMIYISAAETLLAHYVGTAFDTYYVLNAFTLISLSCLMIKSRSYSKFTAMIGLISGLLMIIPSTAGTIGLIFSILSLIPWILFIILLANTYRKKEFIRLHS